MESFPKDILNILFTFIPSTSKKLLNKELFKVHYYVVEKNKIFNKEYQNYLRYLIRKNCDLHVGIILDINHFKFNKLKNWKYKNNTYPTYTIYLRSFARENNAVKTLDLLNEYVEPIKKYKRIRTKNIRWTN